MLNCMRCQGPGGPLLASQPPPSSLSAPRPLPSPCLLPPLLTRLLASPHAHGQLGHVALDLEHVAEDEVRQHHHAPPPHAGVRVAQGRVHVRRPGLERVGEAHRQVAQRHHQVAADRRLQRPVAWRMEGREREIRAYSRKHLLHATIRLQLVEGSSDWLRGEGRREQWRWSHFRRKHLLRATTRLQQIEGSSDWLRDR